MTTKTRETQTETRKSRTVAKAMADAREWILIDANDQVLGRLAVQVANILSGKSKSSYERHLDKGDHVVVINVSKIRFTGKKLEDKTYARFSGYPGGYKETTLARVFEKDPTFPLWHAVRGMLPKNSLGYHMLKKLKIYADAQHPHAAQKPKVLN